MMAQRTAAAPSATEQRRRFLQQVAGILAIGVASRVVFIAVAWAAGTLFPPWGDGGWNASSGFVTYLSRWDSGWYIDVARFGYGFKPGSWAFPPLYPLLVAAVAAVLPFLDLFQAGFVVTTSAFFASLVLLFVLTRDLYDEAVAWRAVAILAFFPASFYLTAVLAEGLLLALILATLLAIHRERWLLAALGVSLAALTRPTGLLLGVPLLVAVALAVRRDRRLSLPALASLPLAGGGTAVFMAYGWWVTGDAFISNRAREAYWESVRWHPVPFVFHPAFVRVEVTWAVALGFVFVAAVVAWCVRRMRREPRPALLPAFAFAFVLAFIHTFYGAEQNIVRYTAGFVPGYWMLATAARHPSAHATLVGLLAAGGAYVAMMWATWMPLN